MQAIGGEMGVAIHLCPNVYVLRLYRIQSSHLKLFFLILEVWIL